MAYDKTQQTRIDTGLCKDCGNPRGKDGTSIRCRPCASNATKRATQRSKRLRKERLADDLCFYCGGKKDTNTIHCAQCRNKHNTYSKNFSASRREQYEKQGVCKRCGEERYHESNYCRMHFIEHIARKYGVPMPLYEALLQKLEIANFTCFYTGIQIVPGRNACVDHLYSRSQHPDKLSEIDNFVWCDKWINRMKGYMSHQEFISLCQTIVNRAKFK